ncbi:MAG: hypothetical protein IKG95_09660 [Bacteroidales bacterium]|nr:hypothetical protein [Bacteroidales bacterium]
MKKLALALVCFASVAFFASCQPENPEPTIAVMSGENYVTGTVENPTIIDINDPDAINLKYGFHVESNAQTKKELASLKLSVEEIYSEEEGTFTYDTTIDLTGKTSFDFSDFIFDQEERNIIAEATIKAVVTDVNNQTNTATIAMKLDQTAVELVEEDITWVKTGHEVQDLSDYGLIWKPLNFKSPFTHIVPAEGCTLFLVENGDEDYANIVTDVDLASYYTNLTEISSPIEDYNKIDCNNSANYHDLLIVMDANDELHAININRAEITTPSAGTRITITGKAK